VADAYRVGALRQPSPQIQIDCDKPSKIITLLLSKPDKSGACRYNKNEKVTERPLKPGQVFFTKAKPGLSY
jgi:hypothetical protein